MKNNSVAPVFIISVIIFTIGWLVVTLNNSNRNNSDPYAEYKVNPTSGQDPGGPDLYEGVCLVSVNHDVNSPFLSKNSNGYSFSDGDKRTLNDLWKELYTSLENNNKSPIENIVEYTEGDKSSNGIFILNKEGWKDLTDKEKYEFLERTIRVVNETVHQDTPFEELSSYLLFYTCENEYEHDWVAFSGTREGELVIYFDWE